jgi:hypothetical protein
MADCEVHAGEVEACVLDWPASCVRLAGGTAEAVALALDRICIECPCHNVVLLGDQTFVFVRSPEGEVSTSISGSDDLRLRQSRDPITSDFVNLGIR